VAEHAWENSHSIDWEETFVLDKARGLDLLMKEALHIRIAPADKCINKDGGLEIPDCWTALVMRHGGIPDAFLMDTLFPDTCSLTTCV